MMILTRLISILAVGASFIAFTTMKVNAVDVPIAVPEPFPAHGNPSFPARVPPVTSPVFAGPGGISNAPGGTANAVGGALGGGMGGMNSGAIH